MFPTPALWALPCPGSATVTATYRGLSTTIDIEVLPRPDGAGGLVHDSFENPPIDGLVSEDLTESPGWDTLSGIQIHGAALWAAAEGEQHLEFDATNASMSRGVSLEPGVGYRLSFQMAGNVDRAANYGIRVEIDGNSEEFWFDSTGHTRADPGWEARSMTFTAASETATLVFTRIDGGPAGWGPLIDAISLIPFSAASEPLRITTGAEGQFYLKWGNGWDLQTSTDLVQWDDVVHATSPFEVPVDAPEPRRFWRLRIAGEDRGILHSATFGGKTYHLLDVASPPEWFARAEALGGHMVTVDDAAENAFLLDTFGPVAVAAYPGEPLLWLGIGLNDVAVEGDFVWHDGGGSPYRNWEPGQPGGHHADEDYVGMAVNFGVPGQWHDVVTDDRFGDVGLGVVEVDGE